MREEREQKRREKKEGKRKGKSYEKYKHKLLGSGGTLKKKKLAMTRLALRLGAVFATV